MTDVSQREADILAARARALSEPEERAAPIEDGFQVMEFALGREVYAVETAYVLEVHSLKEYTPLPCTPAFVLGILNVRGRIFSVLDIKVFFGIPRAGLTDLNKAILLRDGGMEFGILADAILSLRTLSRSDCQPPLPVHSGIREKYLKGITERGVLVLDAKKLLSDPAIIVREEAASGSPEEESP